MIYFRDAFVLELSTFITQRSILSITVNNNNLLRTTGDIESRMQRTAVDYAATFRVCHGTTIESIGPVVVMRALQELHALLRRTGTRRRQVRAADHRGNDIVDDVVRGDVAIPQKRVQVMLVGGSGGGGDWQIVNARRRPGRVDAPGGFRRDDIPVAPDVVVLPAVKLTQVCLLVASRRPAAALPPSLRAEQRRVPPPRQARHASSSSCATDDDKRATTSGPDRRRRWWLLRSISAGGSFPPMCFSTVYRRGGLDGNNRRGETF